jgi:hypothetical protein
MASDYYHKAAAQEEEFARRQLEFEHELRTDPRYQAYLAGYEPASAERFIKHYAAHKIDCLRKGPDMVKFRLHQAIEYQEDAYERMFDIQQKKLFDLQVRWRTGEITLPGVVMHQQFVKWERYPHACPWLPPITPAEYALYLEYLASPACQDVGHHPDHHRPFGWQDYDRMRDDWVRTQPNPPDEDSLDCMSYPDWYAYYDAHQGVPAGYPFATHPDHKGERQEYYCELAWEAERAAGPPPAPYVPDRRPPYYGNHPDRSFDEPPGLYIDQKNEVFADFARRFDPDPEPLIAYHRAYLRLQNAHYCHINERTDSSRELLWDAKGPWPVAAHADWRQGIVLAAQELHRALLLAALPAVFEDYQFRLATGLAPAAPDQYRAYHDTDKPDDDPEKKCGPIEAWTEHILRGRELAGEPLDFEF